MKKIAIFFAFFIFLMSTNSTILAMSYLKALCCPKPVVLTPEKQQNLEAIILGNNTQGLQKIIDLYGINSLINNETLMHWAVLKNRPRVITFLDLQGANVNSTNDDGMTPLHLATDRDHIECMRTLVALGGRIELDQKTHDNRTALDIALSKNSVNAVRVLVHAGADRSRIDWAVIQEALDSGNDEIAILITQGHCTEQALEKVKKQRAAKLEKDKQNNVLQQQQEITDRQKRAQAWVSTRRYHSLYGYGYIQNYFEGY